MLDFEHIGKAPVANDPFPYFAVSNALNSESLQKISKDFPEITSPGIFTLSDLDYDGAFADLIDEIMGPEMESLVEKKFGVDLSNKPMMVTVRGQCQLKDGRIHTDSKDKIVTCLLYLNDNSWPNQGGRLRLLRNGGDMESIIAEIPPDGGNLVAFVRTDCSWHGHLPFEGKRRYIMFNWLCSNVALAKNIGRHKLSAAFKGSRIFNDY